MIIYPAIDLLDGRCVRLFKGDYGKCTKVAEDPIKAAEGFLNDGAKYLHVVDLNSAKDGGKHNFKTIKELCKVGLSVQTGGGIRDFNRIEECFEAGVERVIIGSKAVTDSDFIKKAVKLYGDKIVVGIDAKDDMVMISGWTSGGGINYIDLGKRMFDLGVVFAVFTNIGRDGTLGGVDLTGTEALIKATGLRVIGSGGVNSFEDLTGLKNIGAYGAICGKSIYEKRVILKDLNLENGKL